MTNPKLGTKRQCLNCHVKFYDLNKDPLLCPSCGHSFSLEDFLHLHAPHAGFAPTEEPPVANDSEDSAVDNSVLDPDDDDDDTVSLGNLGESESSDDGAVPSVTIDFGEEDDGVDLDGDDDDDDGTLLPDDDGD